MPAAPETTIEPPGAYLHAITVEGFRGIGPAATLTLTPGPGLTLVVGRNGSGKSSFAEGLEVLLTGGNKRWDGRSAVWKEGWRCLHRPHPCVVRAEFAVEALGTVTVERRWDDGAALEGSTAWFQPKGGARQPYAQLGWDVAIKSYRPLLPYAELGAVFDKPSEIHDALVDVLGLGEFDAIQKTLQAARKAREAVVDVAADRLKGILPRLQALAGSSGDQRAVAAFAALKGRKPDLDALQRLLDDSGAQAVDEGVATLRLATMHAQAPSREEVTTAASELREAAAEVEQSRGTDAGRARALAQLLDHALRYHAAHDRPDEAGSGTAPTTERKARAAGVAPSPASIAPCAAPLERWGTTWRDETTKALAESACSGRRCRPRARTVGAGHERRTTVAARVVRWRRARRGDGHCVGDAGP